MGDVTENVSVEVEGADELERAAEAAEQFAEALDQARDAAAELDAAGDDIETAAEALDQARDAAAELSRAADTARDALSQMAGTSAGVDSVMESLATAADTADVFAREVGSGRDALGELIAEGAGAEDIGVILGDDAASAAALARELRSARDAMAELDATGTVVPGSQGWMGRLLAYDQASGASALGDGGGATSAFAGLERQLGLVRSDEEQAASAAQGLEQDIRSAGLAGDEAFMAGGSAIYGYQEKLSALRGILTLTEGDAAAVGQDVAGSFNDAVIATGDLELGLQDAEEGVSAFEQALSGGLSPALSQAASQIGGLAGNGLQGIWGAKGQIALWGSLIGLVGGAISDITPELAGFASFGALAAPALMKVYDSWEKINTARSAYSTAEGTYKNDKTAANLTAVKTDLAALKAAYASVPADVRPALRSIDGLISAFEQASRKSGIQGDALKDIPLAANAFKSAIPAMESLAKSAAPVISGFFKSIGQDAKSKGFKSWISDLDKDMTPAANSLQTFTDSLGNIIKQLTTPKAVKSADSMFSGIAQGLRGITPGAVDELEQLEKTLGGIGRTVGDWSKPNGFGAHIGRYWDDFFEGAHNVTNWARTGTKAVTDTLKGLFATNAVNGPEGNPLSNYLHNFAKQYDNFSTQSAKTSGALLQNYLHNFAKQYPSFSTAPAKTAGTKAGEAYGEAYDMQVKQALLAHQHDLAQQAGAQTGKDLAKGVSTTAPSALQKSVDNAAKNVKIHGVTVDLADSKLSGLTALQGTLTKAATSAGKAYDTALGNAIAGQASSVTAKVTAIVTDVHAAEAGLKAAADDAGEAVGQGLAAGIEASTPAAVAAATTMANEVTAAVRAAHQTQSPSKVFRRIGRDDVAGYVLGLEDGKAQVDAALKILDPADHLNQALTRTVRELRSAIDYAYSRGDITAGQKMVYTRFLDDDNHRLMQLASRRRQLVREINAADALAKSVTSAAEQTGSLSNVWGETQAGQMASGQTPPMYRNMQDAMRAQLGQIRGFRRDIEKLKHEGLSETLIRQLLAEGPTAGLPIARELLGGGKHGVRDLDRLEQEITAASKRLGVTGANAAYESGRDMGRGLAAGLKAELRSVVDAIDRIAKEMIDRLRADLRTHSPSRETWEIGEDVGTGLAGGLMARVGAVSAAAHEAALAAVPRPVLAGVAAGRGGGGGGGDVHVHNDIVLKLDGKVLARTTQTYTLRRAARNLSSGLKLANRGA